MTKTIINSTIGLTAAFLFTIILHEVAHYIMSIALGYEAILYHNKVFTKTNNVIRHDILIAGIAPVFSLVQGIIAYNYSKHLKTNSLTLFVLWFGIVGIITFFGYLMIAPIITVGDTGRVFNLLNIPIVIQILISIISVIFITLFLMKSTTQFERFAIEKFGTVKLNRKKWSVSLILIPLILSILLVTLFQFPISHIASVLATVCTPFSLMAVFGSFIGNKKEISNDVKGESINNKISIPVIILLIVVIIINRILVNGI